MEKKKNGQDFTIVDIANELNISAATVSRALNDHSDISEATKEKVRKMAQKMGYRRNKIASGLRSKKSYTVGFIIPSLSSYFQTELLTVIQNKMHDYGYNVIICQSNDSFELERQLVNTLYSYRVDALFTSLSLYTEDYSHFQPFIDRGIPVVFYDRVPKVDMPAYIITGDDVRGGYLAANHLIETGCKTLAFINGPTSCKIYHDRLQGYQQALKNNNLIYDENYVFSHPLTNNLTWDDCRHLFNDYKIPPDGILAANDTTAITVLQFAKENQIEVPSQLKIIGYSNDPRSSIVTPSISTIDQRIPEMAEAVVQSFIELVVQGKSISTEGAVTRKVVDISLVRRMST